MFLYYFNIKSSLFPIKVETLNASLTITLRTLVNRTHSIYSTTFISHVTDLNHNFNLRQPVYSVRSIFWFGLVLKSLSRRSWTSCLPSLTYVDSKICKYEMHWVLGTNFAWIKGIWSEIAVIPMWLSFLPCAILMSSLHSVLGHMWFWVVCVR